MQTSKQDQAALKDRLKEIDGGIRRVAAMGGIGERVAHKIMAGDNVRQKTYDAFIQGLENLEEAELKVREANSNRARTSLLAIAA